jgi:hypothetical protein
MQELKLEDKCSLYHRKMQKLAMIVTFEFFSEKTAKTAKTAVFFDLLLRFRCFFKMLFFINPMCSLLLSRGLC